jgi:NADPH-dependent curcumin reductase CurA
VLTVAAKQHSRFEEQQETKMHEQINRRWRLARRPVGSVKESDFEWSEEPAPFPGPGQLLVRNQYLSLDPVIRAWMWQEDTVLPAQSLGSVIRGLTLGRVQKSNSARFADGTTVLGTLGWEDYSVTDGASDFLLSLPERDDIPDVMHLVLFGHIGITAYFGLLDVGRPKAGETLVISSAAGAVGSLVGQIGKLYGCRVIGIAGSDAKCRWVQEELGFDGAINYKTESVYRRLKQLCARGVDIYFDNVGGTILEDVLNVLNVRARIVVCGMLSLYNDVGGMLNFPSGPNNLLQLMTKRAKMEGFVCIDYRERAREALDTLMAWHRAGKLRYRFSIVDGLCKAPRALNRVFDGSNIGKLVIRM